MKRAFTFGSSLIMLLACLTFAACDPGGSSGSASGPGTQPTTPTPPQAPVYFGFNAKGFLNTAEQTGYAQTMLSAYTADELDGMVIRVMGGSSSQSYYPSDWSDADIQNWVGLQTATGVRFAFVVNGNDTPAGQRAFYDRWIGFGATFTFIEMMNEYYLNKYFTGDTTKPGVTFAVTADDYVGQILPDFLAEFDDIDTRFFIILAPDKTGTASQTRNEYWNDTVIAGLGNFSNLKIGVTLHLYHNDVTTAYNYAQIDSIRARIPAGTPIAITESGIIDDTLTDDAVITQHSYDHMVAIWARLQPGDYLFDQVLYHNYGDYQPAVVHPSFGGITPKGTKALEFFEDYALTQ